jgi:hypothetical protein
MRPNYKLNLMKKLQLKLAGKQMLTKEQMKKIGGGTDCSVGAGGEGGEGLEACYGSSGINECVPGCICDIEHPDMFMGDVFSYPCIPAPVLA